jgi:anti-sigma regulatory factor (Ser/Thr protein kinase)
MNLRFDVEAGEYISAGVASSKVKKALRQVGLSNDIIRKVSIAMYEAEINMVIHANGGHIDVELTFDRIIIDLVDNGPGIPDVDQAMTVGYSTASKEAREMGFGAGMGLANIKRNCDVLEIHSEVGKGTTVHIEIKIFNEE